MKEEDKNKILKFLADNFSEPLHISVESGDVRDTYNSKTELEDSSATWKPFRLEAILFGDYGQFNIIPKDVSILPYPA